jgi:hypothetical protein
VRIVAGAIMLLAASILFCKHVDHIYAVPPRGDDFLLLIPAMIFAGVGVILFSLGFNEKSGGEPKG